MILKLLICGLFGYVRNGNIENIAVINGLINGFGSIGSIVGCFTGLEENYTFNTGIIRNCYANLTIMSDFDAGGIVGYAYGNIECCYNEGHIKSNQADGTGGITGQISNGNIKQCYNKGTISNVNAGGIAGWSEEGGFVIEDCYNFGKISGEGNWGTAGGIMEYVIR